MSQSEVVRTIVCSSLGILLLSSACQGDRPMPPPTESTPQPKVAAESSTRVTPPQSETTSPSGNKYTPTPRYVDLAPPLKTVSYPGQNAPLIRYQSPFETGRHNITKQKGEKAFVASPPPAVATHVDGGEHRRRVGLYLTQWEQQKSQYGSLSAEEQEVAKGQLKRRVLGD
jgi:hypothetical protein